MRIVIVGGCQRSGTTLAQTLLANAISPEHILPEAHIACDIFASYARAKAEWDKTSQIFATRQDLVEFYRELLNRYLAQVEETCGSMDYLVLKDPNFSRFVTDIGEILPDAPIVVTVRDPRDIVASFLKIEAREKDGKNKRSIAKICNNINRAYEVFLDVPEIARSVVVVTYERLCASPQSVLAEISSRTNLPLHLPDVSDLRWLDRSRRHKDSWISPLEEGPPSTESIGSYERLLSSTEIAEVQRRCAGCMRFFEYRDDEIETGFVTGDGSGRERRGRAAASNGGWSRFYRWLNGTSAWLARQKIK